MLSSWFLNSMQEGGGDCNKFQYTHFNSCHPPPPLPQFKGIVNGEAIGLNGAYSVKLACNAVPDNHPNRFDAIASTQDKR